MKEIYTAPASGKVMLGLYFDPKDIIFQHWLP
jgi:hypothetical protein